MIASYLLCLRNTIRVVDNKCLPTFFTPNYAKSKEKCTHLCAQEKIKKKHLKFVNAFHYVYVCVGAHTHASMYVCVEMLWMQAIIPRHFWYGFLFRRAALWECLTQLKLARLLCIPDDFREIFKYEISGTVMMPVNCVLWLRLKCCYRTKWGMRKTCM